jgi:hypothetical protein
MHLFCLGGDRMKTFLLTTAALVLPAMLAPSVTLAQAAPAATAAADAVDAN